MNRPQSSATDATVVAAALEYVLSKDYSPTTWASRTVFKASSVNTDIPAWQFVTEVLANELAAALVKAGESSFTDGQEQSANPYPTSTMAHAMWHEGWTRAALAKYPVGVAG